MVEESALGVVGIELVLVAVEISPEVVESGPGPVGESALEVVGHEESVAALVSPPWEVVEALLAALRALRHLHTWPCCNPLACSPQLGILSMTSV